MAKVSCIFQFTNLSAIGTALVDEFQRQHPEIRELSTNPEQRAMTWYTQKERSLLLELAKQVETEDPD